MMSVHLSIGSKGWVGGKMKKRIRLGKNTIFLVKVSARLHARIVIGSCATYLPHSELPMVLWPFDAYIPRSNRARFPLYLTCII